MRRSLFLCLLLLVLLSYGCNNQLAIDKTFSWERDSLRVIAHLSTIEYLTINDSDHTFIHGGLTIRNLSSREKLYNIGNYLLIVPSHGLGEICYDSKADILVQDETIKARTSVNQRVYWAFTGRLPGKEIWSLKPASGPKE